MTATGSVPEGFQVDHVVYVRDFDALRTVREAVFINEQSVPRELELDAIDSQCAHVLARDDLGHPIGTGRLMPDGRIGRMAVLAGWRNRGVGGVMLQRLLEIARTRGLESVHLHAQIDAKHFYARHGFAVCGAQFTEANISHVPMRLTLQRFEKQAEENRSTLRAVRDEVGIRQAIADCLNAARHKVDLLRVKLDLSLAHPDAIDALRRVATSGRGAQIRILLHHPDAALRDMHPLVSLLQRLPSMFVIREIDDPADREDRGEMTLNDQHALVWRASADLVEAHVSMHAPGRRMQLGETFAQKWERAVPCSRLRALSGL